MSQTNPSAADFPGAANLPGVEADAYRGAMARVAGAVHLITTDGDGGRAGFTASAVCSVSDGPPTLLVCINRSSSAYAAVSANDVLCVNTLAAEQSGIATAFGGRTPMETRFAAATWTTLVTGAPALPGALSAFDCRIVGRHPVGTHDVLYCEVVGLAEPGDGHGLVYADRRYHTVPLSPEAPPEAPREAAA
ncbi:MULTISPECIES: flavin reductase [unclassified Methylobacterium]|uniref:flavin reductase n=1 Tax=unclassified Methylobacterium TaxID=2615210 RepID=UPI0006F7272F|nr:MULTISPECIES: flavin reductase [unclassified Methylobacterium]KQP72835.1 FMN reductase [Methylobacterium sp. Leaf113]MCK2056566.1 flavin reductase [Methylobacterium sp. 37f]